MIIKCKGCGEEFETNDKRRKYCDSCRRRKDNIITGGYIRKRGNVVEAKGVMNCILAMHGIR